MTKKKRNKEVCSKKILKFSDYKDCLLNNEIMFKSRQSDLKVFKSEAHNVYTGEINNIALKSNNDKILQTFDRITSYPYEKSVGKVCKTELLSK